MGVTAGARRRVGGLPPDPTTFVGRREATAEVRALLAKARLVTLTGVGGVGKSRLAIDVARHLQRAFPDGVWLVELAELHHPLLVGDAVAAALELPDDFSVRDPAEALTIHLADKRLLLVLDNCEHLLDACALLVGRLLSGVAGLRVLATSREPLGLIAEHVRPVQPLAMPSAEACSAMEGTGRQYEALALFEDRASAVMPDFSLNQENAAVVARLCRRLDGLPLAIELAAVWLRALSMTQILARMGDRYRLLSRGDNVGLTRHQTLRATVDWSFDLCTEPERRLWARLSVFAGGIDLEAAEDVCAGDDLPVDDVVMTIAGLVDKSILTREEDGTRVRYRMLETIRQYGRERLVESGDELAVRRRHRDHYLRVAEDAEADWFGPNQSAWLDRLQADQGNLWAALRFCLIEPGEARIGLRLAGSLWWYWVGRAVRDGRYWLDRALALNPEPSRERAKALWATGWISTGQGDAAHSMAVLDQCMVLARSMGDEAALAYATQWIGTAELIQGRLPAAAEDLERGLRHCRTAGGLAPLTAAVSSEFGMVVGLLGQVERGIALCEECAETCAAHGERWARSWAQWNLAVILWSTGDDRRAKTYARRSLELKRTVRDLLGIPFCTEFLAWSAMAEDDAERAAVLLGVSDTMWRQIGAPLFGWDTLRGWSDHCRARALDVLKEQAFKAAHRRGGGLSFGAALAYALEEEASDLPHTVGPETVPDTRLTRREREVAELIAQGLSNKEIAASLVISQRTAEGHIEHIMCKLGFIRRTQIAAWIVGHHPATDP